MEFNTTELEVIRKALLFTMERNLNLTDEEYAQLDDIERFMRE